MASIIPGYQYDIFISYRQKDNKGDRWVSEFVEGLKTELESTFKEEISVYFDINPHDGLLETHDVDESLKEKLKCLVFIPIISRTFCDPKSFAWEHEFKAFIEQASKDQFGLKVKLPGGNVANRVLPVQIHDLDNTDIKECESVLGGFLRGVEFIFKSPGVNRPLRAKEEKPQDNLNKTLYRDQINKVANSIKEIIQGLSSEPAHVLKEKEQPEETIKEVREDKRKNELEKSVKSLKSRWLPFIAVLALLIIAAILAYPKIFKKDTLEKLRSSGERISVVVMPFQNMTNDTIWNVWQDGIQDILITCLSDNPEELSVKQTGSVKSLIKDQGLTNYASITPNLAIAISQKLDANVFISGNLKQAGSVIRIYAQLIDSKTEEVYKSFQTEASAKEENIFQAIDSLALIIKNFLIISKLEGEQAFDFQRSPVSTNSPEAFRYLTYANNSFQNGDFTAAIKMYSQALAIDSNLNFAVVMLSFAYLNQGLLQEAKKWCLKVYEEREQMPMLSKIYVNFTYAALFETPYEEIKYLKQFLEIDNQFPVIFYNLGIAYSLLHQYDKAIPEYVKALDIYKKWDSKPMWANNYTALGRAYHETRQYKKERKLYNEAEIDFPEVPILIYRQAVLSLTVGDMNAANFYIEKYISLRKERSASEANIAASLAEIYSEAGIQDKAEDHYRKALSLQPESPSRLNDLACYLIDTDRDINEGLELIDKALILSPDDYLIIDTKGWGLYKQGKYQEALEILQKSWDLRMKNAIYNHEALLHLEAAKKAVANKKIN